MTYYAYQRLSTANSLTHHGVKGMKWGVRKKMQLATSYLKSRGKISKNGSLTSYGKARYGIKDGQHGTVTKAMWSKENKRINDKLSKQTKSAKRLATAGSIAYGLAGAGGYALMRNGGLSRQKAATAAGLFTGAGMLASGAEGISRNIKAQKSAKKARKKNYNAYTTKAKY